ncbi:MAG: hypothetical protein ACI4AQ_05585 [Lachnospiraceae bacterium]
MGLFDFWKRKRIDPEEVTADQEDTRLEEVDFSGLSAEERNRYVVEQCEIILECNNNVEAAKKEYKIVGSYFSDIQIIEGQTESIRDRITYLARCIVDLGVDRKASFSGEKKITGTRYLQMQQEEEHLVDVIKNLKNNEVYLQMIKKDMSALTGEKTALKMDTRELLARQKIIKNITIVSLVCFVIIFSIFLVLNASFDGEYAVALYLVLFFASLFAVGDVILYRRTIYNILLTEKKVNRAIVLHNKVKIKYINTRNLIDYQCEKYGVHNSYELADLYQKYLETKTAREKYRQATLEMSEYEEELANILAGLGLYDSGIWLSQVRALADPKEMVEIRHNYSDRRRGLRKFIEDNADRAEKSKASLRQIIADYPEFAQEILVIVEKYDD